MNKLTWLLGGFFLLQFSYSQELGIINNAKTPHMKLKCIDIDDCRWTEGFWAEKLKVAHEMMIPNLGRLMEDPEIIHAYENFQVAAGLKDGVFKGWSFHDGDFYKYVESLAYAFAVTKDETIDQKMDDLIEVISQAQRSDGYICTYIQIGHGIKGFHHESEHHFDNAPAPYTHGPAHELYNLGHLMTAACIHYRLTGKENFLKIAIQASDHLYRHFKEPSPELARVDWNPPHYMGLVEMYRTTRDRKYLELAETFINMLGTAKAQRTDHRGLDHSQRRTPIREVSEAVGHAGHANYLYAGVADLYSETGDTTLLKALERVWSNITQRKMYLTGATGPHHFGISNRAMVAEAYGMEYELPNLKAYNETCANIGHAMFNWRMFLVEGEAQYADIMELVFHNSAISGISLDGTEFFYTNPLRFIEGHPQNTKDEGKRNPFMSVFCCPPNIVRTIAKMHTYAYCTSEKGIWVNLYGSNTLATELDDETRLKLTQVSEYPWEGSVQLKIDEASGKEFSMMLRIPGWATGASVKVNGAEVRDSLHPGTYFDLSRNWKEGDVVELDLPMTASLITAHPKVEETMNQVAIKRGPVVYCLESVDLPEGVNITQVVIPQNIQLKPKFVGDLLKGVVILEGQAAIIHQENRNQQLYRTLSLRQPERVIIKMVPYFAWSNRGVSDMTVWMPLKF